MRCFSLLVAAVLFVGAGPKQGLNNQAREELADAGVDKYLGQFTPALSEDVGDGWVRHTYDPDGGNGPLCIAGTPFRVFTKSQNPAKLMILLQGGGACWQGFYFCNVFADVLPPPLAGPHSGIWVDSFDTGTEVLPNPVGDYSIVYVPYCDGSVFTGDNVVFDPDFPGGFRFHRGLRNLSAAMDLAQAKFSHPSRILLAGSSAGGVGAAAFAPFLARFLYGNNTKLRVFNDAGPVAINLDEVGAIQARADDWQFGQFFPASCTDCSDLGQSTEIIHWRLANDSTILESFYSTDADETNRFFLNVATQAEYRDLLLTEHGALNDLYPDRYKTFIRSGDDEHTALQRPTFYLGDADGVPLDVWTGDFLVPRPFWVDIVEDFVPFP
ncbi:MAG: pectinacetylesterase family protein [Acidobacteriota bacterium]|nr:pectinacetylesterase family protein [Acidobacteriota bacterium]